LVELSAAENIENLEVRVPLTWWDHLKEAHAPRWFLARWPVQYRIHVVDIKAIWSGYQPPSDNKYGPFRVYVHKTVDPWKEYEEDDDAHV
jgi:hypothetical protein